MHMVLPDLYQNPDSTKEELAEYFVEGYSDYYNNAVSAQAINIEKLSNNLAEKIDIFAEALVNNFRKFKDEIKFAIEKSASYNAPAEDGGDYVTHYKDLYNFAHRIYQEVEDQYIKNKAHDVLDAIIECEIYPGTSLGLSIYIPTKNFEYKYDPDYENIDLSKDTSWINFVGKTKNVKAKSYLDLLSSNFRFNRLIKNILNLILN